MNRLLNIYFATHKNCNLNCRYCYINEKTKQPQLDSQYIINSLIDFLFKVENQNYQIGAFCLHGTEPTLMEPETIAEIVDLINEHWKKSNSTKYKAAIQTNGIRLNEKYLKKLESKITNPGLPKISFSIDPPKPVHDFLRNNSFDLVQDNYKIARDIGYPIGILSVVSSLTMQELEGFKSWMKEQFENHVKYGNPYKIKFKFATGEYSLTQDEFKRFGDFIADNELLYLCQSFSPGYCMMNGNECMWFEFDIDGNCYSCNKTYLSNGKFANWKHESFDEISDLRKKLYSDTIEHPDCANCKFELFCNSGCPTDRYKSGNMAGKSHDCTFIKTVLTNLENKGKHIIEIINN